MGLPVVIKSGKKYLTLVLSPDLEFPDLLQEIVTKFLNSEKFFGTEEIAIAFEGRRLSEREQLLIMDAIDYYTSVKVSAIIEQDRLFEYAASEALRKYLYPEEQNLKSVPSESVCTYIGQNVTSGTCISSQNPIVIMGTVEEGGMVSSDGNVIILGSLLGTAVAGAKQASDSVIAVAGLFAPENYKIGSIAGKPVKRTKNGLNRHSRKACGKVAHLADNAIQIDDITQFI